MIFPLHTHTYSSNCRVNVTPLSKFLHMGLDKSLDKVGEKERGQGERTMLESKKERQDGAKEGKKANKNERKILYRAKYNNNNSNNNYNNNNKYI